MAQGRSCSACAEHETQLTDIMVNSQSVPAVEYRCCAPGSPHAGQRVEGPEAGACSCFRPAELGESAPY